MCLIIMEGYYGAIDSDDTTCHGYYIIRFSSSLYNFQADLSIYVQVIYYGEMLRARFFSINTSSHYSFTP